MPSERPTSRSVHSKPEKRNASRSSNRQTKPKPTGAGHSSNRPKTPSKKSASSYGEKAAFEKSPDRKRASASPPTSNQKLSREQPAKRSSRKNPRQNTGEPQSNKRKAVPVKTRGPKIAPPRKRSRKPWIILKIILCVLAVMALIVGFFYIQLRSNLNSPLKSKKTRETYCISDEAADVALNHRVVNVLVFGLDGREADEDDDGDLVTGDRSDAMMICSADFENGAIKITSLMRDTFVWIDSDQTYDKLNASYAFGGPEGAIKTINQNFDTAITDYVSINFEAMVFMVDAVGGVEITFDDPDEVYWTNQYTGHVCAILGREWTQIISGTGTHTLDGCQALGYCRERYTGNGDFDRTQRQRNVLQQVITKALTLSPPEQLNLLAKVMPYLETSLDMNRIIKYGLNVLSMESKTISQMRLPTNDYGCDGMLNDVYYFYPDTLADNIKAFYQYIYKIDYTPSDTAQKISDEIASIEFDDSPY